MLVVWSGDNFVFSAFGVDTGLFKKFEKIE